MSEIRRIIYSFRAGSVPPPHHYEYEIYLESKGGMISYTPDYPADNVPVWQFSFQVTPASWLHLTSETEGILETEWQQKGPPEIGGPIQTLIVETSSAQYPINGLSDCAQVEKCEYLYQYIRGLVPGSAWDEIDLQRSRYWMDLPNDQVSL